MAIKIRSIFILFILLVLITVWAGFTAKGKTVQAQLDFPPITIENADQLEQVEVLGQGQAYRANWLSDGKTLAIAGSVGVWLYDVGSLDHSPQLLSIHTGRVFDEALSPDGTILATGSEDVFDFAVRLWSTKTGMILSTLTGHTSAIQRVVFSSDGSMLASGDFSGVIRLWNVRTGAEITVLQGHNDFITDLAFNSEGSLVASTSWDGSIRVWELDSGEEIRVLTGQDSEIMGVAFSPDGSRLASWSSGSNAALRLWDLQSGTQLWSVVDYFQGDSAVAFSPNGSLLAAVGNQGSSVRLLAIDTGMEISTLDDNGLQIYGVGFSLGGDELYVLSQDGAIYLWDVESASRLAVLRGYTTSVYSVAFSQEDIWLASGYEDALVRFWNLKSNTEQRVLRGHTSRVTDVVFDPTGNMLASASSESLNFSGVPDVVRLWDWKSGNQVAEIGDWTAFSVAFDPSGTLLAYPTVDEKESIVYGVRLWSIEKGEEEGFLQGHTGFVTSVVFDPTGTLLASGSGDGTVRLWDVETRTTIATFQSNVGKEVHPAGSVNEVVFSPDGALLVSSNADGSVRIWNVAQRKQVAVLETGSSEMYGIAFSPNGQLLATPGGGYQGVIQLWDVATGEQLTTLVGHNGVVYSVSFSQDGTLLASAGEDGTIRLWGIP